MSKVKGIVLAGGTGSRLGNATKVTNKHLLPVWNKCMIDYPISVLSRASVTEIMVVTGREHMGAVTAYLGSGSTYLEVSPKLDFTFRVQDEAGGIAQALGLARDFVCPGDQLVVILGDNIFIDEVIHQKIITFTQTNQESWGGPESSQACVFLKSVPDPQRFGVAEINARGQIMGIEEKPQKPKSNLAVTGLYIYPFNVFKIIDGLEPSERGELEITAVNNTFIDQRRLSARQIDGHWTDAGTPQSLLRANMMLANIAGEDLGSDYYRI